MEKRLRRAAGTVQEQAGRTDAYGKNSKTRSALLPPEIKAVADGQRLSVPRGGASATWRRKSRRILTGNGASRNEMKKGGIWFPVKNQSSAGKAAAKKFCELKSLLYLCTAFEQRIELWCNGNTSDFGSEILGSSPDSSTTENGYALTFNTYPFFHRCSSSAVHTRSKSPGSSGIRLLKPFETARHAARRCHAPVPCRQFRNMPPRGVG